ncbi:hypothetical protein QUG98_03345 [Curtobacterium sp. RHCJP20]|uniref:Uncharacterized protein n=1 Tax=Curtobacterium subtropicum TaxID=3055138 RepID=A0ABT7TD37_9MICO|nr:hypothetical protein [Curtobacterium subtropicum]MDM7887480.1 hypothetical protein [Curtobacterium subtropicum]
MKKTTGIATAAGIALALGGTLLAAVPANAATPTADASTTASESIAPVGPTTSWRGVSITKSVVEGDEIVVAGKLTGLPLVNGVRAAAGDGYKTIAAVDANGEFEIRIPSRGDFDVQDYSLQFGRKIANTVLPNAASVNNFGWYAVRV